MQASHFDLAADYFTYLSRRFPVMCASDEFHFIPRAASACDYYDQLDGLGADAIHQSIGELKDFRNNFKKLYNIETDLENQIDLELLIASITGTLIELEHNRSWRHNPLFYLKIAFIGLDHAFSKPEAVSGETADRAAARLCEIPRLLGQAVENITRVPESYHRAAREMLIDCKDFLTEISTCKALKNPAGLKKGLQNCMSTLDAFGGFLSALSPISDSALRPESLEMTLKKHFRSHRTLREVFDIAAEEWHQYLNELKRLQKQIDPNDSWQNIYHAYAPFPAEKEDTLSLYKHESKRLRTFFSRHFREKDLRSPMELMETPTYLRSIRSSASFAAAFTDDHREKSFFYISTQLPPQYNREVGVLLKKRLHREYKFLTAHETIPGHQLLDSIRRKLTNPVRRQIESPLFYEGWATYAETLLTEYGYISNPIERLVDYKRRLWRSARCQIDVGLQAGFLEYNDALNLLTLNGFSRGEARRQIDRFRLNPGYQLCYSLGCYEIKKIVKTFESRLGNRRVNEIILKGGELPFHLIEKRLNGLASGQVPEP